MATADIGSGAVMMAAMVATKTRTSARPWAAVQREPGSARARCRWRPAPPASTASAIARCRQPRRVCVLERPSDTSMPAGALIPRRDAPPLVGMVGQAAGARRGFGPRPGPSLAVPGRAPHASSGSRSTPQRTPRRLRGLVGLLADEVVVAAVILRQPHHLRDVAPAPWCCLAWVRRQQVGGADDAVDGRRDAHGAALALVARRAIAWRRKLAIMKCSVSSSTASRRAPGAGCQCVDLGVRLRAPRASPRMNRRPKRVAGKAPPMPSQRASRAPPPGAGVISSARLLPTQWP